MGTDSDSVPAVFFLSKEIRIITLSHVPEIEKLRKGVDGRAFIKLIFVCFVLRQGKAKELVLKKRERKLLV